MPTQDDVRNLDLIRVSLNDIEDYLWESSRTLDRIEGMLKRSFKSPSEKARTILSDDLDAA